MGTVDLLLPSQHPPMIAVESQISSGDTKHLPSYLKSTLMRGRKSEKPLLASSFLSVRPAFHRRGTSRFSLSRVSRIVIFKFF